MDNDTKSPEIKVTRLGGIDLRSGRHALEAGKCDRIHGLYPSQNGLLSRIPGKRAYRILPDREIIGLAQTFDGTGNIIVQDGDRLSLFTLDEFLNRQSSFSLTPSPNTPEEDMSYALLLHVQNNGVDGGTLGVADNVFYTGTITTEASDADGIVSIASNQFTLGAGVWRIRASVVLGATGANELQARVILWDDTNSAAVLNTGGSNQIIGTTMNFHTDSVNRNKVAKLSGRFTTTGSTDLEIQISGDYTDTATVWSNQAKAQGCAASSIASGSYQEVYKIIEIIKEP